MELKQYEEYIKKKKKNAMEQKRNSSKKGMILWGFSQ